MNDTLTPSEIEKLARWCGWLPDDSGHPKWRQRKERSVHKTHFESADFAFGEVWPKLAESRLFVFLDNNTYEVACLCRIADDSHYVADEHASTPTLALLRAALVVIDGEGGE